MKKRRKSPKARIDGKKWKLKKYVYIYFNF